MGQLSHIIQLIWMKTSSCPHVRTFTWSSYYIKLLSKSVLRRKVKQPRICFCSIKTVVTVVHWVLSHGKKEVVEEKGDKFHRSFGIHTVISLISSFSLVEDHWNQLVLKKSVYSRSSKVEVFRQTWPHENPRSRSSHPSVPVPGPALLGARSVWRNALGWRFDWSCQDLRPIGCSLIDQSTVMQVNGFQHDDNHRYFSH